MNAYIINDGMAVGLNKFRCSNCGDNIRADHSIDKLKHCWNCGSKFGPEPKKEPSHGDWYYNPATSNIYTDSGVLVADVCGNLKHIKADGYLMAASKKLLAACKKLMQEPYEGAARDAAREAIAEAEKGMQ